MHCKRRCRTKAGEAAHMFRCHGLVADFRQFSDTTACPACLKEYHTFDRLHAHLRQSQPCRGHLRGLGIRGPIGPGIGSARGNQLKLLHDGLLPFQHGAGPRPAPAHDAEEPSYHLPLYEHIALVIFEHDPVEIHALRDTLIALVETYVISWTLFVATIEKLLEDFDSTNCELARIAPDTLASILAHLRDPRRWHFLDQTADGSCVGHSVEHLDVYEVWCEQLVGLDSQPFWHSHHPSPQRHFAERIILHAYSGRRRPGDFQWFLEDRARQFPDLHLIVVSLDLVIDPHHGDIGQLHIRTLWYNHMRQGYVVGFLSGPPCCTWSRARGIALPEPQGRPGPRVLRDADHLWGFDSLSLREMDQVMDGHVLLGFSLVAMTILATTDGAGLLEHPAEPEQPDLASIWRLPVVQLISALPGMRMHKMAQGLLGSRSPKPTGLLALNLPLLPQHLVQWAVCPDLPKSHSIGRDGLGAFKTAELKEYPPAMNAALAQSFFLAAQGPILDRDQNVQHVPEEFVQLCSSMVSHDFGQMFGPDCAV